MPSVARRTFSASVLTLRSGLGVATTPTPWSFSREITPDQLADSANAPWTRTTVMDSDMGLLWLWLMVCSAVGLGELDGELDLDGRVRGQDGDADGAAGVDPGVAEDLPEDARRHRR